MTVGRKQKYVNDMNMVIKDIEVHKLELI